MSSRRTILETVVFLGAVGAASATAAGVTALARGQTRGAPGVTKALSALGRPIGGGMLTGVAVAGGTGALVGLSLYRGVRAASS